MNGYSGNGCSTKQIKVNSMKYRLGVFSYIITLLLNLIITRVDRKIFHSKFNVDTCDLFSIRKPELLLI